MATWTFYKRSSAPAGSITIYAHGTPFVIDDTNNTSIVTTDDIAGAALSQFPFLTTTQGQVTPPSSQAPPLSGIPAWKPNTFYPAQYVVQQNGIVYSATTSFTSGATFSASNWTALTAAGTQLALAELTSNPAALTTAEADIAGLSITFVAPSRPVKLALYCYSIQMSAAASFALLKITDSANAAYGQALTNKVAAINDFTCATLLEQVRSDLTAGNTYTFKARGFTSAGTGTPNAGASFRMQLRAEQI